MYKHVPEGNVRTLLAAAMMALCAGMTACAGGASDNQFGPADGQAIRKVGTDLETAFNAKDVDKILALYTDNSVFMPPNKPVLRGRDPLKSFYSSLLAGGSHDLKITVNDVAGHGPIALRERRVLDDERRQARSRQVPCSSCATWQATGKSNIRAGARTCRRRCRRVQGSQAQGRQETQGLGVDGG